jgi:antitoxin CcdA
MLDQFDTSLDMQDGKAVSAPSSTTLSVDEDLLEQARQAGVDVPAVVDRALRGEIARSRQCSRWKEENRATIEVWNEDVRASGLWSDGLKQY